MTVRLNPDLEGSVIKMLQEEIRPGDIANQLDVHVMTVYRIAREEGIETPAKQIGMGRPTQPLTEEQARNLELLFRDVGVLSEVVSLVENDPLFEGVSLNRMRNHLIRKGLLVVSRRGRSADKLASAVEMYEEGENISIIVEKTGISAPVLYKELDQRGIERRRGTSTRRAPSDRLFSESASEN